MVHRLNSFLAFGCHNRNILATVASWSDHHIEEFLRLALLKELGEGTQVSAESGITDMELFILRRHFGVYFGVGSGHN